MTVHYLDKANPDLGSYEVSRGPDGYRWTWCETAKGQFYKDHGEWWPTEAAAYRDAANDWEYNGNRTSRLAAQLRAAATRSEKKAASS